MISEYSTKLTVEMLIARIDNGEDVEFECCGKRYTICGWCEAGPNIAEQVTEANEQTFKDGADLVDHYLIDGKTVAERIVEMKML